VLRLPAGIGGDELGDTGIDCGDQAFEPFE
jgi:hypothetical protein